MCGARCFRLAGASAPSPNRRPGGRVLPGPLGVDDVDDLQALAAADATQPPPVSVPSTTRVNGTEITVLPDGYADEVHGARTSFDMSAGTTPGYEFGADGRITKLSGPIPVVSASIQTAYGPGHQATDLSGYGRGTTAEDKQAGNVTLGFHESCHRGDYLEYVGAHAVPVFGGKPGQTEGEYKQATKEYFAAVKAYRSQVERFSAARTDEVGSPPKSRYRE